MRIREVQLFQVTGQAAGAWTREEERAIGQLDIYPEFAARGPKPTADAAPATMRAIYVEILTDDGVTGIYGPLFSEQAFLIAGKLRPLLLGRDPLAGELLWDLMARSDRHARAGQLMMAISAVDCALWDLRGKHFDVPVYRLLGGPTRETLPAYASMYGHELTPERIRERAQEVVRLGFTGQKWFFRHGPSAGAEGREQNLLLVRTLREAVGDRVDLMFDAWMGWDVRYAIDMAREMAPYRPAWLEEALPPHHLDGFIRLKAETGIPLAAGEHLYTRWDIKPYLDAGVFDVIQADPDWTGGITELLKICALAAVYDVQVVPHGHNVNAAAHVVAAQPPGLCPRVEFLLRHLERQQYFHRTVLRPVQGSIPLPTDPGLGIVLDEAKVERREEMYPA